MDITNNKTESLFPEFKQDNIRIEFEKDKKEIIDEIFHLPKRYQPLLLSELNKIIENNNTKIIETELKKLIYKIQMKELIIFAMNFK